MWLVMLLLFANQQLSPAGFPQAEHARPSDSFKQRDSDDAMQLRVGPILHQGFFFASFKTRTVKIIVFAEMSQ